MLGWVRNLIGIYGAGEFVAFGSLNDVPACLAGAAVRRGLNIPKRP
jgi:GSH-dependent disulfide-bond oxidoreductase